MKTLEFAERVEIKPDEYGTKMKAGDSHECEVEEDVEQEPQEEDVHP